MDIHASVSDSVFKVKFDPHHLKLRKSSSSTPRKSTHSQPTSRLLLRKQYLKSQKQRQFSKERRKLRSLRMKLRQLASSSYSESGTSKRQRTTKSPKRLRRTTNPKSPAVSTSPTETKLQRNLTARKTLFRISKHGKPSSTHGSTCPARRSDYKLSNAVCSITALNLYGG